MSERYEAVLRIRVGTQDAHYAGGLVAGAWIMGVFGDLATELCIEHDRDEGLLRSYNLVDFLEPIRAGDFIEARGWLTRIGRRSRGFVCEARRVAELDPGHGETAARLLDDPVMVARAEGTVVVPNSAPGPEGSESQVPVRETSVVNREAQ